MLIKHHHGTNALAAGKRRKAVIDLIQPDAVRDQLIQLEPAIQIFIGDPREVPAGSRVAVTGAHDAFLAHQLVGGNDLITPRPDYGFIGLKAGDQWCVCLTRWKDALDSGVAPPIVLAATHEEALAVVPLAILRAHAA